MHAARDGWLLTPTGSSLRRLDPARLSKLDWNGKLISGDQPSKEIFLHLEMYQEREKSGAVVHLHATHSVAVSVLDGLDPNDLLPPLTAGRLMESTASPAARRVLHQRIAIACSPSLI